MESRDRPEGSTNTGSHQGGRPGSQWNQLRITNGSRYTGQAKSVLNVSRSKMEDSLRKSAKACKAAAAVTAEWIRDTHRSLQRQELRWEGLEQEVRSQRKEVRNLAEDAKDREQGYEKRLQLLEDLVLQQGRALGELKVKYENESRLRRQASLAAARSTELFKPNKPTLLRDVLKIRSAIGESVPDRVRRPLGKVPAGVQKGSGSASVANQLGADIGAENLLERVSDQVYRSGQGIGKGVSVSVVMDMTTEGYAKDVGAPRNNPLETSRTPTKVGPTVKKVAVKRRSEGKLDGEIGCSGRTRKLGGGKTAKLLPIVGASLQTIPGGEGGKTETGEGTQETKELNLALVPSGILQLTDSGAIQPVKHSGHPVGASSLKQAQKGAGLQARGQEAARSSDTKLEKESLNQVNFQEKLGQN